MIYNKRHFIITPIIHYYIKWIVSRQFHELLFNTIEVDKSRSVLLIANHFSFWDGLILFCVNTKLLKKKLHVMVSQENASLKFLKFAGAFSVSKNSRDIIASLDHAAALLSNPQNLVLIYPQGKLFSNFVNEVKFEKGVWRIMQKTQGKFQLIFAATFIQYFKHKKPNATVYLKSTSENYNNITQLRQAYQQHYSSSRQQQTEIDI